MLLHNTYRAGDAVRLSVPTDSNAVWTPIDLVDFQQIADSKSQQDNSVSVAIFVAEPGGVRDSSDTTYRCNDARALGSR